MSAKQSRRSKDPFFVLLSGRQVTRHLLVKALRARGAIAFPHIPPLNWNGYSLRKGGATSTFRAGVPGETIEKLGDWKTDIYKKYIVHDTQDIATAQTKMATNHNRTR